MSCGGCSGKSRAGSIRYVKAASGRHVSEDRMTTSAMTVAGFTRKPVGGVIRWAYLDWYGVPYPLRLYLWVRGKVTDPAKLPGCGCLKLIKDGWYSLSLMFVINRESLNGRR